MIRHKVIKIICVLHIMLIPCSVFAKSGSVNYSWGADALAYIYPHISITAFAVISAFQIYIKMISGEDGFVKHVLTLFGACLFIIGASLVLPAFFGYRI